MAKSAPGTSTRKPGAADRKAHERAAAARPPQNRPPDARRLETARPAATSASRPKAPLPPRAATTPVDGGPRVQVRALELGYYDHARRRPGDVFSMTILDLEGGRPKMKDGKQVGVSRPCSWVEPVDPRTPTRTTGAQQAIDQRHDEILGGRAVGDRSGEASASSSADDDDMLKG